MFLFLISMCLHMIIIMCVHDNYYCTQAWLLSVCTWWSLCMYVIIVMCVQMIVLTWVHIYTYTCKYVYTCQCTCMLLCTKGCQRTAFRNCFSSSKIGSRVWIQVAKLTQDLCFVELCTRFFMYAILTKIINIKNTTVNE